MNIANKRETGDIKAYRGGQDWVILEAADNILPIAGDTSQD